MLPVAADKLPSLPWTALLIQRCLVHVALSSWDCRLLEQLER